MVGGNPTAAGSNEEQPVIHQPECPPGDPSPGDVAPAAQVRIQMARHHSLRLLTCEHRNGVLVLRGQVATFHHKQLAQESVRDVPGVELIKNLVQVVPRERMP